MTRARHHKVLSRAVIPMLIMAATVIRAEDVRQIPGFQDGTPFLVRVVTVRRMPPQSRPWEYQRLVTDESPGFFVDGETVLAGRFPTGDIISVQIRVPGTAEPYEAEVKGIEPELQVAALKIIGRSVRPSPPRLSFVTDERLLLGLRQVDCVSATRAAPEVRTVFLKRPRSGRTPSGNGALPTLRFSGWEGRVSHGDVLVSERSVVGIVLQFSGSTRIGSAIPGPLVATFLEAVRARESRPRPAASIDSGVTGPDALSILAHAGFETVLPTGHAQRLYLGSNTGGVIVRRVLPYNGAASILVPGDVIVAVRGQPVSASGTLTDSVFGSLPVETALVLEDGRFAPPGTSVKLTVSRRREIREVTITTDAFSRLNRAVSSGSHLAPYWILGGLALVELTEGYVRETGGTARLRYLSEAARFRRDRNDEAFIVLQQVLPTTATEGYEGLEHLLVIGLNGTATRNLVHLRELVRDAIEKKFALRLMLEGNREIVLDPATLSAADDQVRKKHGIQFLSNLPER